MNQQFSAIGHIRTPFKTIEECPRNVDAKGALCHIIIDEAYVDGLFGLCRGDKIIILYWLDQSKFSTLTLPSRKTGEIKGIFALRTPHRPNPIGVAEVTIDDIAANKISVRGLDCLDMTPLLDIKPAMNKLPSGRK